MKFTNEASVICEIFEWFIYPRLPQSASATTRKPEKIFRCLRVATRPSMNFGQENSCSNYFCVVLLFLTFSCLSDSVISTPIIWLLCCASELERLWTVWSGRICFCSVQCAMLLDTSMSWKKTSDLVGLNHVQMKDGHRTFCEKQSVCVLLDGQNGCNWILSSKTNFLRSRTQFCTKSTTIAAQQNYKLNTSFSVCVWWRYTSKLLHMK